MQKTNVLTLTSGNVEFNVDFFYYLILLSPVLVKIWLSILLVILFYVNFIGAGTNENTTSEY